MSICLHTMNPLLTFLLHLPIMNLLPLLQLLFYPILTPILHLVWCPCSQPSSLLWFP